MLIAHRNGMLVGGVYTAKSYVQDGLIAMWDGIENVGFGQHSNSTTTWVDLSGHNRDAALSGTYSWLDDCWHVESATNRGLAQWNALNLGSSQTIEIVIHPYTTYNPYDYSYGRIISEAQPVPSPCVALGFNAPYMYGYGLDSAGPAIQGFMTFAKHSHQIIHPSGGPMAYHIDNNLVWTKETTQDSTGTTIGCFANNLSYTRGIDADYFAVRLYSRALTADEIAANYAVDKARFNLP